MSIEHYSALSPIQLFLQNLDLLGFEPQRDACDQAFQHLIFDTSLYQPNTDNTRAFECTSYFLFKKLDPVETKTKFASCWPIQEYSPLARTYRMTAYQWLVELKERQLLLGPISLRRSYFESCPGHEAFISIMLSLSILTLQTVIDRDYADPNGKPIRLIPSYKNVGNIDERLPLPNENPETVQYSLQTAIQALSTYVQQQKHDFIVSTNKSIANATLLKQAIDTQRKSLSYSSYEYQYGQVPDLTRIKKRMIQYHQAQTHQQDLTQHALSDHILKSAQLQIEKHDQIQNHTQMTIDDYHIRYNLPSLLSGDTNIKDAVEAIQTQVRYLLDSKR
ncbi:HAUS augmin-like complex subunit 6 N-terminus-domain-containing protein [Halteromyces radiatus]|uniref:HAUS augmin-like complex subunit 6 N-terminus-domain-containing protein n=1 Tax=Halteromyces radiatus TaxID=101107 RepID=UPI00221F05A7|nr:HAUS augmin-like complex subunit 6 N-terminus-domain-containing protein [Halteromyces radiatus]KAI8082741.1 HAUS augmin-like complex subunit 6 N-terminus-domain-containing protein [Halteromyces radiatus]